MSPLFSTLYKGFDAVRPSHRINVRSGVLVQMLPTKLPRSVRLQAQSARHRLRRRPSVRNVSHRSAFEILARSGEGVRRFRRRDQATAMACNMGIFCFGEQLDPPPTLI